MTIKKFAAVAVFAFAFAFAAVASAAVTANEIYSPASGFLRVGSGMGTQVSQMPNVMAAQRALNACTGSNLAVDGKFGPLTRGTFVSFQVSKGLAGDGVIGPLTAAQLAACSGGAVSVGLPAGCTSATGFSTTTGQACTPASLPAGCMPGAAFSSTTGQACTATTGGALSGTEGDLSFGIALDSDVTIDLGDSEEVIEIEVEAEDGDVLVDRVEFLFDARPWLYFDEVNLLVDGKEAGSLSSEGDFSEVSGDYRARFSNVNTTIKKDTTSTFTLELKVLSSMAGTRDTDTVNITMDDTSFRYVDGSGAIMTGGEAVDVDVTFDPNFGVGDVSVSIGDNSPESATILLDEDARTNEVSVLEFDVEAQDSDIEVKNITVAFSSNASSVADTVYRAYLYRGSNLLKSKSVSSNTTVFDDIDYDIDEDEEETFTVKLDFNKTDGIVIDEFTVLNVVVEAENSDFESKTDTLTVNETHKLVVEGLVDSNETVSATPSALGDDTIGKFTFKLDLTAYEADFYINEDGSDFTVTLDGNATTIAKTIASTNAFLTSDDSYRINKGQTRTFTLEVQVASTVTGTGQSVRATLDSVDFNTDSDLGGTSDTLDLGAPDYRSGTVIVFDKE